MFVRPRRVYLAGPYTSDKSDEMQSRNCDLTNVTANLVALGYHVFSPITHNHQINERLRVVDKKPNGFDFYRRYDLTMIAEWADETWVLPLPRWNESKGVLSEIDFTVQIGKPVLIMPMLLLDPKQWNINLLPHHMKEEMSTPAYDKLITASEK